MARIDGAMIDPVKLAERHEWAALHPCSPGNTPGSRDTATALRLLAAYAEAAGAEIDIRQRASGFCIDNPHKPPQYCLSTPVGLTGAKARTDAARAALEQAGVKIGGGE